MKLTTTITILLLSITSVVTLEAQEKSYQEGHSTFSVGYGFPNLYRSILKSAVKDQNTINNAYSIDNVKYKVGGYGPLFFKYEYALSSLIGVGAVIGYYDTKLTQTYNYEDQVYNSTTGNYDTKQFQDIETYKYTSLSIGARLNFHFGTSGKLDPYAGIATGYTRSINKFSYSSNNPNYSAPPALSSSGIPIYLSVTAGLKFYFDENFAAYAELGIDKWSVIQGGGVFKF